MIYLTALAVAQTIHNKVVRRSMNNELENMWKEAVMAWLEVLFRNLPGWSKENHDNLSDKRVGPGQDSSHTPPGWVTSWDVFLDLMLLCQMSSNMSINWSLLQPGFSPFWARSVHFTPSHSLYLPYNLIFSHIQRLIEVICGHFQSWTKDVTINTLCRYFIRWSVYTFFGPLYIFRSLPSGLIPWTISANILNASLLHNIKLYTLYGYNCTESTRQSYSYLHTRNPSFRFSVIGFTLLLADSETRSWS
jgi:hypothetical protein